MLVHQYHSSIISSDFRDYSWLRLGLGVGIWSRLNIWIKMLFILLFIKSTVYLCANVASFFLLLFFYLYLCLSFCVVLHMKSSFPKRDKRQNEFVMPFCCVLNLFTAPSMFHAKSLYFLV